MLRRNVFAFVCLLAFPVSAMAETRVDMDRSKDFRQYRTFTVEVSPPIRNGEVDETNTIAVKRLRDAVTSAFRARGLMPTDDEADLVLRVASRETERIELVSSWPADPYDWYGPWGYGYGRRSGYGRVGYWGAPYWDGWGGWGGDVWTYRYLEGTTAIDVIERSTGDLVYRAEVTAKVDDDEEDLNYDAVKVARKAFKKYPAGGVFVD
jgi:hypothetical protein